MYRHILRSASARPLLRYQATAFSPRSALFVRGIQTEKYMEKLQQRAKEAGLSVEELKEKAKEEFEKQKAREREELEKTLPINRLQASAKDTSSTSSSQSSAEKPAKRAPPKERKDSSPVKPLSNILNLERLFSSPHTVEQINSLWTIYHAKAHGGTGRGAVCASVPLDLYKRMESVSQKYPAFVVPLPRPRPADAGPLKEGENDTAYEFYFMQWSFHEKPPVPNSADPNKLFDIPTSKNSTNPPLATVLFTPLQEYKSRQTFATPYMIATFYTDLATTHNTVLMRGEITPSAASATGGPDTFLLSQGDAQVLIMMLQRFYLWDQKGDSDLGAAKVLKTFHEKPEDFRWEDLVKASSLTA